MNNDKNDLLSIIDNNEEQNSVLKEEQLIPVESLLATGRQHISYSELHDWIECPWRHKIKYIEKIQSDSESIHTIYGQHVHAGIESYLIDPEKKPIDSKLFIEKWHNEIIPGFISRMKESNNQKAIDDYLNNKNEFDNSFESIFEQVPVWLELTFPGWELHGAEVKLFENIGIKKDRFFKGFIDCVIVAPDKKGVKKYYLIDWKTTSWGWSFDKKTSFEKQLQLILYKHFFAKKYNIHLKDIKCSFVLLKRKPPKLTPNEHCEKIDVSVGPKTETRALELVDKMLAHLNKNLFPKNRNSCKFCQYKNTKYCP